MKFVTSIDNLFKNNKNIILYFYYENMNYHKKFVTMLSKIEKQHNNIFYAAVNINLEQNLHLRFKIKSVPCLIFYSNDIEVYKHEGMLSFNNLNKLIEQYYIKKR